MIFKLVYSVWYIINDMLVMFLITWYDSDLQLITIISRLKNLYGSYNSLD